MMARGQMYLDPVVGSLKGCLLCKRTTGDGNGAFWAKEVAWDTKNACTLDTVFSCVWKKDEIIFRIITKYKRRLYYGGSLNKEAFEATYTYDAYV